MLGLRLDTRAQQELPVKATGTRRKTSLECSFVHGARLFPHGRLLEDVSMQPSTSTPLESKRTFAGLHGVNGARVRVQFTTHHHIQNTQ